MSYKVENKIIPNLHQRELASTNFVIAHDSGNPNNVGPNSLDNEVKYMTANSQNAFTSHWVGSGGRVVKLAQVGKVQWGAGPKANPYSYAQVELARTNNRETFEKDYPVYIELLRDLAKEAKLPLTFDTGSKLSDKGIKSHEWISKHLGGTDHVDPFDYLASWGISRSQFKKDLENGIGKSSAQPSKPSTSLKSIDEIAKEVIAGKWGNGEERKNKLKSAGYDYEKVQTKVNQSAANVAPSKPVPTKSVNEMAKEVMAGLWGNGEDRKKRLEARGYNASKIQEEVNRLAALAKPAPKLKSTAQVAKEVIEGKWGNGDARKSALTKAGYNFTTIQNEVNRLAGQSSAPKLKDLDTVAKEVIAGKWGNGAERKKALEKAGYEFNRIQKRVNEFL